MKPVFKFLRTTITGGVLFLLPVVLVVIIFAKAYTLLERISAPLSKHLPPLIGGMDGSKLLTILLLVFICFLSGLIFRSRIVRRIVRKLEDKVLAFLPGYSLMKAITADTIGADLENKMISVLVSDAGSWTIGFLTEEANGLCTIFIPRAPRLDSGQVRIVSSSKVKKINMPANQVSKSLKSFGKGILEFVNQGEDVKNIWMNQDEKSK